MPKQAIQTDKSPIPTSPYSQALRVGDFIFVSGTTPTNPETGTMPETIEDQTRQVLDNIKEILEAGGASMDDVVKSTVHLSDLEFFARFNSVYATYFNEPRPVRTTVGSQLMNMLVEIDVVAYVGKD
ncbi:MAG: reactive intermediate/imine deaminase [Anaerolineaceae bacterium]|nr:reactive intermediate/imine deaminase [Anaerolineaceae bacterium]